MKGKKKVERLQDPVLKKIDKILEILNEIHISYNNEGHCTHMQVYETK